MMSRWFLIPFFTVLLTVFYAVAISVLLGIRDNYHRYAQKERLQWTDPGRGPRVARLDWKLLLLLGAASAVAVVEGVIL